MDDVVFKCSYFDSLYRALALQQHLDYVLNDVLCNARSHFKIGVTYLPHDRIYTYIDYCRPDRRMYVIAVIESPDDIANAEDAAIARYSLVHSVSGHPGCENRSRDKLGAFQGHSPFSIPLCWELRWLTPESSESWSMQFRYSAPLGSAFCGVGCFSIGPFCRFWQY